jgi:hypothetical protein
MNALKEHSFGFEFMIHNVSLQMSDEFIRALDYKKKLEEDILRIERQICDVETSYIVELGPQSLLSVPPNSSVIAQAKIGAIPIDYRIVSLSSNTSPVSRSVEQARQVEILLEQSKQVVNQSKNE